jgi:hypothetical protein
MALYFIEISKDLSSKEVIQQAPERGEKASMEKTSRTRFAKN